MQLKEVALHLRRMRAGASVQSERSPPRMDRMQRICNPECQAGQGIASR